MRSAWFLSTLRWVLLLSVCWSAGCGWQLQGRARLPDQMTQVYLQADDNHSDFTRALRSQLRTSGVRVVGQPSAAAVSIHIHRDESGQRVLSVSSRNTPEEYEVYYVVEYSISEGADNVLPPQQLQLTRDYSYDENVVLAKQREHAMLRAALANDLAAQVIRRMASL